MIGISNQAKADMSFLFTENKLDSVFVKGERYIYINNQPHFVPRDTIFVLADTADFFIRKNKIENSEEFYSKIGEKMSQSKVAELIYDQMFVQSKDAPKGETKVETRFIQHNDFPIIAIDFKKLAVFGSNINDTSILKPPKGTAILNAINTNTQNWIIRKNLSFEEGQPLSASKLVESERLLRQLHHIRSAKIMVNDYGSDAVDIAVVTRDVFPYSFIYKPNNDNQALFGISSVNIGGLGHELEYDYIKGNGSDLFYRLPNIQGTFIDAQLNYAHHFRRKGFGLVAKKKFITRQTKHAGGASLSRYRHGEYNYEPKPDISTAYFYDKKYVDLWGARAFSVQAKSHFLGIEYENQLVVSFRTEYSDFYERPNVAADTNYRYHDNLNVLASIGLSSRKYFKDRFISQFGLTEDIPTGGAINLITGYQRGEFRNRVYTAVNYSRGGYVAHLGYFNSLLSIGSYIGSSGPTDGIFKLKLDFFSQLYSINHYKFRQFVKFSYSKAIRPDEEYIVSSERNLGLRGVSSYYLRATEKLNLQFESIVFSPKYILGFRAALFAFADYTMTKNKRNEFFNKEHFSGYGLGLRLRNANLAISSIQLRFGFYSNTPLNASLEELGISTSTNLKLRDFDFQAPEIIPFN